jgi:hypothetical protein
MKNFKRFLQTSKKLEELQIARKAREVDEVQKFNLQLESHKQSDLVERLDAEQALEESRAHTLDEIIAGEQRRIELATDELLKAEDFEAEAFEVSGNADGFRELSGIQDPGNINRHHQIKQLPAGSPDPFDHELSDLTETCLQRELEKNETVVKQMQEEEAQEEEAQEEEAQEEEVREEETQEEHKGSAGRKSSLFFNPRSI